MKLNEYIDHTKLGFSVTEKQIETLCLEARTYAFKSVCINPIYILEAKKLLAGSNVLICTVIGFPHGSQTLLTKVSETKEALSNGAQEFDLVLNIANLKNKHDDLVLEEIRTIKNIVGKHVLKLIIETSVLTQDEIVHVSKLAIKAGADFVKTSTGYGAFGARVEDVQLMLDTVGNHALVKASGGIRTYEDAIKFINLGVKRIGTSNGISIIENKGEEKNDSNTTY